MTVKIQRSLVFENLCGLRTMKRELKELLIGLVCVTVWLWTV